MFIETYVPDPPTCTYLPVKEIALHRNNVLKNMIQEFAVEGIMNCTMHIVFINDRGEIEEGRGSGVTRGSTEHFLA